MIHPENINFASESTFATKMVPEKSKSTKLQKVNAPYNKYSSLIDTSLKISSSETQSSWGSLFFAEQSSKDLFSDQLENFWSHSRKLGTTTKQLVTMDETSWVGEIYMGSA